MAPQRVDRRLCPLLRPQLSLLGREQSSTLGDQAQTFAQTFTREVSSFQCELLLGRLVWSCLPSSTAMTCVDIDHMSNDLPRATGSKRICSGDKEETPAAAARTALACCDHAHGMQKTIVWTHSTAVQRVCFPRYLVKHFKQLQPAAAWIVHELFQLEQQTLNCIGSISPSVQTDLSIEVVIFVKTSHSGVELVLYCS